MSENQSAHSMAAGDTQQQIFDANVVELRNDAHEAIHSHGIPISELIVFCVDEESTWFDIFAPYLGDLSQQKRLQADEIFVFHGVSYISQLARKLNHKSPKLGDLLKVRYHDPGLVKCVVLDDEGISVFHIQPIPRLLN